jgi:hypothetical protein
MQRYMNLLKPGPKKVSPELTQEERAVVLKAYDYGIQMLDEKEMQHLNAIIGALKSEIWP